MGQTLYMLTVLSAGSDLSLVTDTCIVKYKKSNVRQKAN